MDLHTGTRVCRSARADEIAPWGPGFGWLAGLGNARADATGIRFHSLPFSADRILARLAEVPSNLQATRAR